MGTLHSYYRVCVLLVSIWPLAKLMRCQRLFSSVVCWLRAGISLPLLALLTSIGTSSLFGLACFLQVLLYEVTTYVFLRTAARILDLAGTRSAIIAYLFSDHR